MLPPPGGARVEEKEEEEEEEEEGGGLEGLEVRWAEKGEGEMERSRLTGLRTSLGGEGRRGGYNIITRRMHNIVGQA